MATLADHKHCWAMKPERPNEDPDKRRLEEKLPRKQKQSSQDRLAALIIVVSGPRDG